VTLIWDEAIASRHLVLDCAKIIQWFTRGGKWTFSPVTMSSILLPAELGEGGRGRYRVRVRGGPRPPNHSLSELSSCSSLVSETSPMNPATHESVGTLPRRDATVPRATAGGGRGTNGRGCASRCPVSNGRAIPAMIAGHPGAISSFSGTPG
jgi:hypothetical protein